MSERKNRLEAYKEKLEHRQESVTKEKAIMELVSNAEQMEALSCCIRILADGSH